MKYDKKGYSDWKPNSPNSWDPHPYISALESTAEFYRDEQWDLDNMSKEEFQTFVEARVSSDNAHIRAEKNFMELSKKDFDTYFNNRLFALRDYYFNYLSYRCSRLKI